MNPFSPKLFLSGCFYQSNRNEAGTGTCCAIVWIRIDPELWNKGHLILLKPTWFAINLPKFRFGVLCLWSWVTMTYYVPLPSPRDGVWVHDSRCLGKRFRHFQLLQAREDQLCSLSQLEGKVPWTQLCLVEVVRSWSPGSTKKRREPRIPRAQSAPKATVSHVVGLTMSRPLWTSTLGDLAN